MDNLRKYLDKYRGGRFLFIFPHPDDESYVAAGLIQLAQSLNINTKLICITRGERGINPYKHKDLRKTRVSELKEVSKYLNIDELVVWDYQDAELLNTKSKWIPKLTEEIKNSRPDIVVSFDPSGITGHPDHLTSCCEVLNIIKSLKKRPKLFWRVPDTHEANSFRKNPAFAFKSEESHILNLSFREALTKIKAIYMHKSQMPGLIFRLQILEWYLFDHRETYHEVNLKKEYKFKYKFKKKLD